MSALLFGLFAQSALVQFLLLSLFGLVCAGLSLATLRVFNRWHSRPEQAIPVATFIGTITTAWALALGFAAADIWSARSHAEQAASEERSTIMRLAGMAQPDAMNMPVIVQGLAEYIQAVREHEWGEGANREPAEDVDRTLQQIRIGIVQLAQSGASEPLISKMTQDFDELQDARNKRLALGASSVSPYKWHLVLFLTLLSCIAIAVVHADRPKAAANSLAIFGLAAVVSLWILALHALPYSGSAAIGFQDLDLPQRFLTSE